MGAPDNTSLLISTVISKKSFDAAGGKKGTEQFIHSKPGHNRLNTT